MATKVTFPKDGEGFQAEVKIGENLHLILRAVYGTAVGPIMRVYDVKADKWRTPAWAADIDDAKINAEGIARALHKKVCPDAEFPELDWQPIQL
jgi:hypothetical protein